MKNIFKSILAIAAGAALLSSCVAQLPEPLASSVSVSSSDVTLAAVNGSATIDVTADGEWFINATNTEWVSFNPTSGNGKTTVVISAQDNTDEYDEINGPRSGMITVVGADGLAVVNVKQSGESGLDSKRTYTKVANADDIEFGKAYLLIANDGKALQAAKSFSASSEGTYSYLYTDEVVADGDVITTPNANNGFVFVKKDDGFAIQEPNGRYLFQAASYNNFYSTTDISKADVWTATANGDGTFKIENQTVSGKYFQYSIGYASYGAYGGAQDNSVMPSLYKDSAAPSDEVLEVAATTTVAGSKTSASIAVKSNKTWKVRNHDNWIKSFTASGTGDGTIEVTFDDNKSYEETREATFQIIGETTNFEVTLIQDHLYHILDVTIAEVLAAEDGDQQYRISGAVTKVAGESAKYGTNFYVKDATGEVYVYGSFNADESSAEFSKLGIKEGDILTITGPKTLYKGTAQLKNAIIENAVISKEVSVSELIKAPVASTYLESQYYKVTGVVKSIVSAVYGNLYLKDTKSDEYIYVYGVTNAPVAKNDKSFASLEVAEGDILTIVGQRGQYAASKVEDQKEQVANAFYVSHETPASDDPATLTLTDGILPTAYPTEETEIASGSFKFNILNVANYGNGIQMKKGGSYIATKVAFEKNIKQIRLNCPEGKTWYPTNLELKASATAGGSEETITPTTDDGGSTYNLSGKGFKCFTLTNTSTYAVYMSSIVVDFE